MDDTLCENFFLQPTHTCQRRYEALRAVFVEHRPLHLVAQQHGYAYGTLRNLVTQFRAQCHSGQVPPFSPHRRAGGLPTEVPPTPNCQPSPISGNSPWPQAAACAAVPPACSCSCRCWRSSALIAWSQGPVTPGLKWFQRRLRCSAC